MTPIEDRLLEIADNHDRRASRLSDRKNVAAERQSSLAIRAALLSIATLRGERDTLRAENAALRKHAEAMAESISTSACPYPIEDDNGTTQDCIDHGHCGCNNQALAAYRAWKDGK